MARDKYFKRPLRRDKEAMTALREMVSQGYIDEYIRQQLNTRFSSHWGVDTIRRARRQLGFKKDSTGDFSAMRVNAPNPLDKSQDTQLMTLPPHDLTEAAKADWFREQFKRCHLYGELQRQFTTEEVIFYLEEYGRVCTQFADIVISEFMQIDDFLKHRLLLNRVLREQNETREEIEESRKWLDKFKASPDDDAAAKKQRLENVRALDNQQATLRALNERYDKLVAARDKIYQGLSATRRDRIDQLKNGNTTFFQIVASILQDASERDEQGKFAELSKMAAKDVEEQWRADTVFPDGSTDAILIGGEGSEDMMPGEEDER